MRDNDGRKLDHRTLEVLRMRAVKHIKDGAHPGGRGAAAGGTGILVSTVNPTFRDPMASVSSVHTAVLAWEIGNAVRLVLAAAAAVSLLRWRTSASDPDR